MGRGLLQGLEERVEGRLRQHVDLVDDVDLAPPPGWRVAGILAERPHLVDPAIRGAVDLDHVERTPGRHLAARLARGAGHRAGGPRALAVQTHREEPGRGRLAHAPGPGKQVRVGNALLGEGVPKRPDDRRLPDDRVERERPPAPREHLVAHRGPFPGGPAPPVGRKVAVHPPSMTDVLRSPRGDSSGQGVPRHTRGSADRCSLPGLAGLADSRRVGPSLHHRSPGLNSTRRHLGRGFRLAGADCEYRAPLPPRLARPRSSRAVPPASAKGMAEREGFEPSTRLLDVYTISSRAPSAARAPLPGPAGARSASRPWRKNGGGGGIRTHVGAHHPQLDFESSPVRPLRYPSARRVRKNACISSPASTASTPPRTRTRWFHAGSSRTPGAADDRPGLLVQRAKHERRRSARAGTRPRTSRTARRSRRASPPSAGSSPPGTRGIAQRHDLGMRRRIAPGDGPVVPAAQNRPSRTTTAPTGTSPALGGPPGLLQRDAHERLVDVQASRRGGGVLSGTNPTTPTSS